MRTTIKEKMIKFACSPKAVKAVNTANKIAVGASAALASVGMSGMNVSAADQPTNDVGAIITSAAAVSQISDGYKPFLEPSIVIICAVAGIRLGMKFIKGAAR